MMEATSGSTPLANGVSQEKKKSVKTTHSLSVTHDMWALSAKGAHCHHKWHLSRRCTENKPAVADTASHLSYRAPIWQHNKL